LIGQLVKCRVSISLEQILLENLIQLVDTSNSPPLMEPENSLPLRKSL